MYPDGAGALKLWDIQSKSSLTPVSGTGESFHTIPLPLILKHNPDYDQPRILVVEVDRPSVPEY